MSYKDTKAFHKDFGDGGRKARKGIEKIAERKEQKYNRLDTVDSTNDMTVIETTAMECNDCGYIGDEKEDFVKVQLTDEGDFGHECPVCSSLDCSPYSEEEI